MSPVLSAMPPVQNPYPSQYAVQSPANVSLKAGSGTATAWALTYSPFLRIYAS